MAGEGSAIPRWLLVTPSVPPPPENAAALEELLKEHQSMQPALAGCKPAYK